MALKLSTGLRNMLLGKIPAVHETMTATTIAAVQGTPDSFTDSGSGLLALGLRIGDLFHVDGFTSANNNGVFTVSSVVAGTIETSETTVTDESAGDTVTISCFRGGSLKDIFRDGILRIYSGSQPADADAAVTGTLLVEVTIASGAWTALSPTNGLRFGTAASGAIAKDASVWSGVGLDNGTAGYFRLFANPTDAGSGSDTTHARIDGSVGTSGAQLNMSSTTITSAATTTIDTFSITLPAS